MLLIVNWWLLNQFKLVFRFQSNCFYWHFEPVNSFLIKEWLIVILFPTHECIDQLIFIGINCDKLWTLLDSLFPFFFLLLFIIFHLLLMQAKLSISGREFRLILIARRSRHYAGTRLEYKYSSLDALHLLSFYNTG